MNLNVFRWVEIDRIENTRGGKRREGEGIKYHFKSTGGGEGGETVTAEELAGGDAHDRWGPLGTLGKNGVTHGLINLMGIFDRNGLMQLLVDFFDETSPISFKVELGRHR